MIAASFLGIFLLPTLLNGEAQGQVAKTSRASESVMVLLETHCIECHGGEKIKGGFDLTTREGLLRGGEGGPAIVSGNPDESLLYLRVTHQKEPGMPYKREKLTPVALVQFVEWIKAGVPYDRPLNKTLASDSKSKPADFTLRDADRQHWAFQPLKPVEPPATRNQSWPKTPVDRFILEALEANGVAPAPVATKEQLIRRVTFDLIGLPPTLDEIDGFANDVSAGAYEKLVDRLLASAHYGERWGRHWLDLARFAESDGFEHDAVRPNAWRYRDYVVKSFNQDKPFDCFIKEQIAGDELYPGDNDALVATAFNLLGPDMVDSADQLQRRHNTLNDMTDTAGLVFLSMTIGCARCHDHKFEPISQRDYYRMQAFFTPATFRNDLPIPTKEEQAAYEAALGDYTIRTKSQQEEIAQIELSYRQKLHDQKLAKLSGEAQLAHRTPSAERTAEQLNQIQETSELLKFTDKEMANAMSTADRTKHKRLQDQLKKLPKPAAPPTTMALQSTSPSPAKTFVLYRGDPTKPGEAVEPGYPEVLSESRELSPRSSHPINEEKISRGSRGGVSYRSALANWIASPKNPLTARIMVNRIWQHHFGRGIVTTPSDFGTHGQRPTHPELLGWLANEFIARGWSIKQIHKLLLLSATYQQSTHASQDALTLDAENKLFSRRQRERLEGEVIRDSLLAISGQLNPAMSGPGLFPPIPTDVFKGAPGWTVSTNAQDHTRRSLYIFARRNLKFPFLEVFDAPDSNLSCPVRGRSTSAPQSLTMLNADEVIAAAQATGARAMKKASASDDRVTLIYRSILGRYPSGREMGLSREFLDHSPIEELCRALFNVNAFVYVE